MASVARPSRTRDSRSRSPAPRASSPKLRSRSHSRARTRSPSPQTFDYSKDGSGASFFVDLPAATQHTISILSNCEKDFEITFQSLTSIPVDDGSPNCAHRSVKLDAEPVRFLCKDCGLSGAIFKASASGPVAPSLENVMRLHDMLPVNHEAEKWRNRYYDLKNELRAAQQARFTECSSCETTGPADEFHLCKGQPDKHHVYLCTKRHPAGHPRQFERCCGYSCKTCGAAICSRCTDPDEVAVKCASCVDKPL